MCSLIIVIALVAMSGLVALTQEAASEDFLVVVDAKPCCHNGQAE